jgi:hypothetical protein
MPIYAIAVLHVFTALSPLMDWNARESYTVFLFSDEHKKSLKYMYVLPNTVGSR